MYKLITPFKLNNNIEEIIRGLYTKNFFTLKGAIKFSDKNNITTAVSDKNNNIVYTVNMNNYKFENEPDTEQGYEVPFNKVPISEYNYFRTDYFSYTDYKPLKILKYSFNKAMKNKNLDITFDIGKNKKGFFIFAKSLNINYVEDIINTYNVCMLEDFTKEDLLNKLYSGEITESFFDSFYTNKYKMEDVYKAKELYIQKIQNGYWKYIGNK